jgi:hypothetical protein
MRTHLTRFVMAVIVLGAAFASTGRAAGPDEACNAATACNPPLLCENPQGQCGAADAKGTCLKVPAFCQKISRPVCGCNGKTYPNDCERQRARAQLDHAGACKKAS